MKLVMILALEDCIVFACVIIVRRHKQLCAIGKHLLFNHQYDFVCRKNERKNKNCSHHYFCAYFAAVKLNGLIVLPQMLNYFQTVTGQSILML